MEELLAVIARALVDQPDAVKVNNAESERQYLWEQTIGTLSRLELRARMLSSLAK